MDRTHSHGQRKISNPKLYSAVLRKLHAVVALTSVDEAALESLFTTCKLVPAGQLIGESDDERARRAYVVMEGWALRFRLFEDGRRQICRIYLAGDFIGLSANLRGMPNQIVAALTDTMVGVLDTLHVAEQLRASPNLLLGALRSYAMDTAIMEERIASIGRRSAYERLAHILIELYVRLETVGEASSDAYSLPLTQEYLADLLGLTNVHINRVLGRLRRDGLIAIDGKTIKILAKDRLMRIADFSPHYLTHRAVADKVAPDLKVSLRLT